MEDTRMNIAEKRTINVTQPAASARPAVNIRWKFIIGGLLIIAAVVFLIVSSLQSSTQYFLTVKETQAKGSAIVGREIRISGAVIGSTIQYDAKNLTLKFTVAHTPGDNKEVDALGGLAKVLHMAVVDPNNTRMQIVYKGVKPDLLRDEAQAIMTGKMGADGVFQASELLLKCPTKYEEAVPNQTK
jgi:cytochrome c-type biogenesis protein CcmE